MKLEKIFENNDFIIYYDNKGWDFVYDIENKNNKKTIIKFINFDKIIEINDWCGFFNSDKLYIDEIIAGNYEIIED